jgi:molecular chaperone GrpE
VSLDREEDTGSGPVVRDKRRIDPVTGEVRERQDAAPAASSAETAQEQHEAGSDTTSVQAELAERIADLQRLQAEYLNYKRRVDRDKDNARKNGVAVTLSAFLPVLDDIARARDHGELTGGFKAVADTFERAVEKLELQPFGQVGDEFDPHIHDALMHSYSDDVTGPTCAAILQVGYRIGDRVLRPAMVSVAEPTAATRPPADDAVGEDPVSTVAESPGASDESLGHDGADGESSYDNGSESPRDGS